MRLAPPARSRHWLTDKRNLPLVYKIGWLNVWLISVGMLALWGIASFFVARSNKTNP